MAPGGAHKPPSRFLQPGVIRAGLRFPFVTYLLNSPDDGHENDGRWHNITTTRIGLTYSVEDAK